MAEYVLLQYVLIYSGRGRVMLPWVTWLENKLQGYPEMYLNAALIATGSILILAAFLMPSALAKAGLLAWVISP